MPFANYKNFQDCVNRNRDKKDPEGYCATIMRRVEGKMKINKFIPITKVDDDQRMVYGYASTPDLDSDGEIIEVQAFKNALPKYMQFPTIREMHQHKAIGTTKEANLKDKGLYIGAKIVADEAWKMVKEGVYKGFSVGGNVVQRVKNKITDLDLVEISLVDVPSNKAAVIELWKKDDTTRKVASALAFLTREEVTAMAKQLKKEEELKDTEETDETEESEESEDEKESEAEDETEETDESEDESDSKETMKKLDSVVDRLQRVDTKVKKDKVSLSKSVSKIAGALDKMAGGMESLNERVTKLEKLPRNPKSKSAMVYKSQKDEEEQNSDSSGENPKVAKIRKELAELEKLHSELGPNEYARRGYSRQAGTLLDQLTQIQRSGR